MDTELSDNSLIPTVALNGQAPKVSIGMPVYNGEAFIREAIDSLLAQTFTDFELIISDNASTDGTDAICREYAAKDARIRYERQAENRGAIANFKFVLEEAVGEYFMWAAADDLQYPEYLDRLVDVMEGNPDLCCVMSDVENIALGGTKVKSISALDDIRLDNVTKDWGRVRKRFFRNPTSNIFFCVYGLFRIGIVRAVDLDYRRHSKYVFSSEIPLMAQVARLGPIASIPIPLKIYRRHEDSIYHKEQKTLSDMDRLKGYFGISKALTLIISESNFEFAEKISLYAGVFYSGAKWTAMFFIRKILRKFVI